MKNKFIKLAAIVAFAILGAFSLTPKTAYALDVCADEDSPIYEASGCGEFGGENTLKNTVGNIISAVIGILGLVAVGFIVLGGVQYMTSAGDPGKAKKAKDTILYACVGLAIAALAFAITNFAINAINNEATTSEETSGAKDKPEGETDKDPTTKP